MWRSTTYSTFSKAAGAGVWTGKHGSCPGWNMVAILKPAAQWDFLRGPGQLWGTGTHARLRSSVSCRPPTTGAIRGALGTDVDVFPRACTVGPVTGEATAPTCKGLSSPRAGGRRSPGHSYKARCLPGVPGEMLARSHEGHSGIFQPLDICGSLFKLVLLQTVLLATMPKRSVSEN